MTNQENIYGAGENPPYSLYQAENGKWGLIDGSGMKLPAEFTRGQNDCFSRVPWEVVEFDEKDGFTLLAWYDPLEVWFNFTFDDPAYPEKYAKYLWKNPKCALEDYIDILKTLLPDSSFWLVDYILKFKEFEKTDAYLADDETLMEEMLGMHPELEDAALTNQLMDCVMKNEEIDEDIKHVLWCEKVNLDYEILNYFERKGKY